MKQKINNSSVYLLQDQSGNEFLAISNLESYFFDGDFLKLVQFLTQQNKNEDGLREFKKIDFALYDEDSTDLRILSKRYSILKELGSFPIFLKNFYEKKANGETEILNVELSKAEQFIQNITCMVN